MDFMGALFGIAALVMFIVAVASVFKGHVARGVFAGLFALVLGGISGMAFAA
jgi:hypothetical protein